MMNILLVARHPVGGIRTYFRYIYSQDVFSKHQFTLIAPDATYISDYLKDYLPDSRIKLIVSDNSNLALLSTLRNHLKENNYDLIHSHGFSAGALTVMARPFCRVPHMMTAHETFTKQAFIGVKGKFIQLMLNVIFKRLDCIVTVSEDAYNNFLQFVPFVSESKVQYIEHGINVNSFYQAKPRCYHKELSIDANRKIIGYFGRFSPEKGFIDLVNAIKILSEKIQHDQMPLVLTFGWGGYIRENYQEIKRLGLDEFFMQMPETNDMPATIAGVSLVVMPSHWEACGLLAMESLVVGAPIVGTNCIGLREVLHGSPAAMVLPKNPGALAEAIANELICSRKNKFCDYSSIAVSRFSLDKPVIKLNNLYDKLMGL